MVHDRLGEIKPFDGWRFRWRGLEEGGEEHLRLFRLARCRTKSEDKCGLAGSKG